MAGEIINYKCGVVNKTILDTGLNDCGFRIVDCGIKFEIRSTKSETIDLRNLRIQELQIEEIP